MSEEKKKKVLVISPKEKSVSKKPLIDRPAMFTNDLTFEQKTNNDILFFTLEEYEENMGLDTNSMNDVLYKILRKRIAEGFIDG